MGELFFEILERIQSDLKEEISKDVEYHNHRMSRGDIEKLLYVAKLACEKGIVDDSGEETVPVSIHRLKNLEENLNWVLCLEASGVDNWEGFDIAKESFEASKKVGQL